MKFLFILSAIAVLIVAWMVWHVSNGPAHSASPNATGRIARSPSAMAQGTGGGASSAHDSRRPAPDPREIAEILHSTIIPMIEIEDMHLVDVIQLINNEILAAHPDLPSPLVKLSRETLPVSEWKVSGLSAKNIPASIVLRYLDEHANCISWIYQGKAYVGRTDLIMRNEDFLNETILSDVDITAERLNEAIQKIADVVDEYEIYGPRPTFVTTDSNDPFADPEEIRSGNEPRSIHLHRAGKISLGSLLEQLAEETGTVLDVHQRMIRLLPVGSIQKRRREE